MKTLCGALYLNGLSLNRFSNKTINYAHKHILTGFVAILVFCNSNIVRADICQNLFSIQNINSQHPGIIVQTQLLGGANTSVSRLLTFVTYNLRNFGLTRTKDSPAFVKAKARAIAQFILASKLDVIGVQELLSVEDGILFAKKYLRGEYVFLTSSNMPKRIVGFWVKKSLPYDYVEVESHYDITLRGINFDGSNKVFSSDIPTLHFYKYGKDTPEFSAIVAHFKADRSSRGRYFDADKIDNIRMAQVKSLQEIALSYLNRFGKDYKLVVIGDYNIRNHDHTELSRQLYRRGILVEASRSNSNVRLNYDEPSTNLVDGVLVSSQLANYVVSNQIIPGIKTESGDRVSDHDPMVVRVIIVDSR